jgi:hypothetical protein
MVYTPQVRFFFRKTSLGVFSITRYAQELIERGIAANATIEFTSECILENSANILQN